MVSVVIRSYQRPKALLELVQRLRIQRCAFYEVVIYEMSDDPELVRKVREIDPRVRIVVGPQRDPPAARNEAVRHARGDIILFIDDDDLPIGPRWIERHLINYRDPACMGVVGRATSSPEDKNRPRFPHFWRHGAMRHTFFKDTVARAGNTLRKRDITCLPGTNTSVRRSLIERIGGWDEGIPMHEEQSFAIKFQKMRRPGEYLVFDPNPLILRRTNLPGGLDRRTRSDWFAHELEARLFYYEHVVGHYFPHRYRLLYPLFVLRGLQQVLFWIWDGDNAHWPLAERIRATALLGPALMEARRRRRFPASAVHRVAHVGFVDALPDVASDGLVHQARNVGGRGVVFLDDR
jgi:glycosyltransferase involved in cell wall biosynthesis